MLKLSRRFLAASVALPLLIALPGCGSGDLSDVFFENLDIPATAEERGFAEDLAESMREGVQAVEGNCPAILSIYADGLRDVAARYPELTEIETRLYLSSILNHYGTFQHFAPCA